MFLTFRRFAFNFTKAPSPPVGSGEPALELHGPLQLPMNAALACKWLIRQARSNSIEIQMPLEETAKHVSWQQEHTIRLSPWQLAAFVELLNNSDETKAEQTCPENRASFLQRPQVVIQQGVSLRHR